MPKTLLIERIFEWTAIGIVVLVLLFLLVVSVPDKYYSLDEYETRGTNFLGPYGESYFENTLKKVIDRAAKS